jgi:hypothetical protein
LIDGVLRAAQPDITIQHAENPADALRAALRLAGGRPVLFLYEKLALARDALAAVGAEPWPEAEASPRAPAPPGSADPEGAGAAVDAAAAVVQNAVLGAAEAATPDPALVRTAAAETAAVRAALGSEAAAGLEAVMETADPEAVAAGAAVAAAQIADRVAHDGSADYDTLAALSGPASA